MKTISALTPNISRKLRKKKEVKFVIIHYTGMQSEIESLRRLKNPKSKVSCHYLINRKGLIYIMADQLRITWHAGKSKWKNIINLNAQSIGIELVNRGHRFGYQEYTSSQINSLIKLCKYLKKKFKIKKENFLGHSDIAPLRKIDPGEKFPWKKLTKFSLGTKIKPKKIKFNLNKNGLRKLFFKNIYKIGYRYFELNNLNKKKDKLIISSFQRRYNPKSVTGKIDLKTFKISHFLANN